MVCFFLLFYHKFVIINILFTVFLRKTKYYAKSAVRLYAQAGFINERQNPFSQDFLSPAELIYNAYFAKILISHAGT